MVVFCETDDAYASITFLPPPHPTPKAKKSCKEVVTLMVDSQRWWMGSQFWWRIVSPPYTKWWRYQCDMHTHPLED